MSAQHSFILFCVDLGFLTLYIIEFGMRMGGHCKDYFPRSFWGWLDLIIIIMGVVSSMSVAIAPLWEGTTKCTERQGNIGNFFDGNSCNNILMICHLESTVDLF